ncbi:hypothetical protein PSEUDO8O_50507 [Pseudomonas sp. 8O]|nr:hypothetical protein PSEUDO8O_50507 [Pseudomonas sp. 8O]
MGVASGACRTAWRVAASRLGVVLIHHPGMTRRRLTAPLSAARMNNSRVGVTTYLDDLVSSQGFLERSSYVRHR